MAAAKSKGCPDNEAALAYVVSGRYHGQLITYNRGIMLFYLCYWLTSF